MDAQTTRNREAVAQNSAPALRTLMVMARNGMEGDGWPAMLGLRQLIAADQMSDILALHRALGVTLLDGQYFAGLQSGWGRVMRRLPFRVAQALELIRRREEFDVVLTWGELNALRVGALMQLLRRRPAHVCYLFWISKWKKALPLRLMHRGIDRMIIGAPLQYRFAIKTLRLPDTKVVQIPWSVDTRFWRPLTNSKDGDMICSIGLEMRDYDTLLAALRPLAIPCHIAASNIGAKAEFDAHHLPDHVTVGTKSALELRELYARSRFVVVPLLPTDSDNGITTCLEAMAMGRAVICTQTNGQVGVLEHGVNSIRVPPRDHLALREAIELLWADPGLCERLGAAGRRLVEERYGYATVIPRLVALCQDAAAERRRL